MSFVNHIGRKVGGSIDAQIGAGANDGVWSDAGPYFDATSDTFYIGSGGSGSAFSAWMRWTGISIPAGAIITSAYISVYFAASAGTPQGDLYFNDVAAPAAPTTPELAIAKVPTTAHAAWNPQTSGTWVNSPDIKTIIQELVNSHAPYSAGAMMALWYGVGEAEAESSAFRSYEYAGNAHGPKLHIGWA